MARSCKLGFGWRRKVIWGTCTSWCHGHGPSFCLSLKSFISTWCAHTHTHLKNSVTCHATSTVPNRNLWPIKCPSQVACNNRLQQICYQQRIAKEPENEKVNDRSMCALILSTGKSCGEEAPSNAKHPDFLGPLASLNIVRYWTAQCDAFTSSANWRNCGKTCVSNPSSAPTPTHCS